LPASTIQPMVRDWGGREKSRAPRIAMGVSVEMGDDGWAEFTDRMFLRLQ
jgi:hypothetical protein